MNILAKQSYALQQPHKANVKLDVSSSELTHMISVQYEPKLHSPSYEFDCSNICILDNNVTKTKFLHRTGPI
jgi:hypothetical protein